MDGDAILKGYGLREVAKVSIQGNSFVVGITDTALAAEAGCVYGFVVAGKVVRVGSTEKKLTVRIGAWGRDVTARLSGRDSKTGQVEADGWREILPEGTWGTMYARPGTEVTTVVGTFSAFRDEERTLIAALNPRFSLR